MKRIAVLLSTYNGEEFLEDQIESIFDQRDVDLTLFIRDDGSNDSTKEILRKLKNNKNNLKIYYENNVGVGSSFMRLIETVPDSYDYYCFSDQDDIWFPDKLISAINKIQYEEFPTLYTSNQTVFEQIDGTKYLRYKDVPSVSYCQILHRNLVAGCTMVWNKDLQAILSNNIPTDDLLKNRIHDVWVAMVAACLGKIVYDSNSYILYRQHNNNVVGVKRDNYLKTAIQKVVNPKRLRGRSKLAKEILERFKYDISDKAIINTLERYAFYSDSIKNKVALIKDPSLVGYTRESYPDLILKVLFNLV